MLFPIHSVVSFVRSFEGISCLLWADSPKQWPLWFGDLYCKTKRHPWGLCKSKFCVCPI